MPSVRFRLLGVVWILGGSAPRVGGRVAVGLESALDHLASAVEAHLREGRADTVEAGPRECDLALYAASFRLGRRPQLPRFSIRLSVRTPFRWCTTSPRKVVDRGAWPSQNAAPSPGFCRLLGVEVREELARSGTRFFGKPIPRAVLTGLSALRSTRFGNLL